LGLLLQLVMQHAQHCPLPAPQTIRQP